MNKKLLCILMCIVLVIGAIPFGVSAKETGLAPSGEASVYYIETYDQLRAYAKTAQADCRYILNDFIDQDDNRNDMEILIPSGAVFNLDLNGYTINRSTKGNDCALFRIASDGRMTITDTSKEQTGSCSFSEGYADYYKAVFYNEGGELEILGGYYQIFSPYQQGECCVVRTTSGYTNIYGGTFDSSESWGGDTISVGHNAYLYDVPHVVIFDGEFFGKYGNIDVAPFDNYLKNGCLYPSVYVLGGNFYITKESDSNGFAYCNNGWGTVIVAEGTVPYKCLNARDQMFVDGVSKKFFTQTFDDYEGGYYEVTAPPMIVTEGLDYHYRLMGLCDKRMVKFYGNSVYEMHKDDFDEIMERIDTVVVGSDEETAPYIHLKNRTLNHKYVNWYMVEASDYNGENTSWTYIGDAYGVNSWQPDQRPRDGGSYIIRCVVTDSDLNTYEDMINIIYEPVAEKTILSFVEISGIDAPVAGEYPDTSAQCSTEGCRITKVEWYDATEKVFVNENDTFKAGRQYSVAVTLQTEENYLFQQDDMDVNVTEGTINGQKAITYGSYENEILELGYEFAPCAENPTKPTTPTNPTTPTAPTKPSQKGILGDANEDGTVNVKDATLIQKVAASLVTLSDTQYILSDVNSDTKVNVKDATAIQKFAAMIETGYPIGQPM